MGIKVSQMPSTNTLTDNDLIMVVQDNENKKINKKDLQNNLTDPSLTKKVEELENENAYLQKVIDQLPQVTGQGTSITLENTIEAQFTKFEIEGNSTQDGTPSPDNEVPILSAGDNGSINEKIKNADGTEEQDYSIFVQQPMRSIGDVRDVFFKNTVDSPYYDENLVENGWYERHPIHRLILTGDEEWNMLPTSLFQLLNIPVSIARSGGLCNRYRYNSSQSNLNKTLRYGEFAIQVLANGTYLYFKNTDFTDTESFKADLKAKYEAGTPVCVDYLLAGPLNLPCTETQIQQLENIPSTYKDFTIIQSQDETEAYLEVSGIYDLNNLINN